MTPLPRLYAIADAAFGDPVEIAHQLFAGGARLVQIRNKRAGTKELLAQVESVLEAAPLAARVIVNDRVDVALISKAHGVHLGQDDIPVEHARAILGGQALIGLSTHTFDQAVAGDTTTADYIAIGPIFPTASKDNPDKPIGLKELCRVCAAVHKPVVAIGGITRDRAAEILEAGSASIAVISDLLKTNDVVERTKLWNRW